MAEYNDGISRKLTSNPQNNFLMNFLILVGLRRGGRNKNAVIMSDVVIFQYIQLLINLLHGLSNLPYNFYVLFPRQQQNLNNFYSIGFMTES